MATSGTYSFSPNFGEMVQYAFGLAGVRRTAILQEHLADARMAANLLLAHWANKGPNLWTVDLQTVPLVAGTATYSVPGSTIMILDAYIRTENDAGVPIDRPITAISRTDYASFPNKESQGYPTVFWFDRQIAPTITLWQVPNDTLDYELRYYRFRQTQDTAFASGLNVEVPYRFFPAFSVGLAAWLARTYAPDRVATLTADSDALYDAAAEQDTENAPVYFQPQLGGYYR
ncbi:hypothetical protein OIU35_31550 [Boseaceae bacterium BT-24-1]|nr:hypothetical protein [Boseaceae bacterium BT-24-1]